VRIPPARLAPAGLADARPSDARPRAAAHPFDGVRLGAVSRAAGRLLAVALLLGASACRSPAPPPPAEAGPDARSVSFESRPPGAEVVVAGRTRCRTPCSLRLDPGRYRVALKMSGYMPWESDLAVRLGADERVEASLVSSH
jgi:hypothetical protein